MIPLSSVNGVEYEKIIYPTDTYKIEVNKKHIRGSTNGLEAIKQAIYKILMTERYIYPIYDSNYGIELADLYGKDRALVCSLLEGRISDALLADDRIEGVDNFELSGTGEAVIVAFKVITNVVDTVDMEVTYNV